MKIRNNISILIFVVTILICPCIFAADYTQHENFGNKIPGDVISFTVTPPGTVLTGSVQNPGGFIWTGGPASFTGTIPEDFAGSHNGLFTGTYQPPEGGEGEGKPHTFTWETTTEAVVVKVASITPASQTVCLGTETEFQVETDPAGHYDMISVSVSGATVVTAYNTSTGKIKVKFDQVSTSSTDYKTVTATLGTSSKTANTLVAEVASIEGPSAVCLGAPETFIATPAPIDASFPSGSPKWQYKKIGGGSGGGSPWVNAGSGPTTTITFAEIGKYKVKAKCGESEKEVEVCVVDPGTPPTGITAVNYIEHIQAPWNNAWGAMRPTTWTVDIEAYFDCSSKKWKAIVTQADSGYDIFYRLLSGVNEASASVATVANYCKMISDLQALGGSDWYVVAAVEAHERIHVSEWRNSLDPEFIAMRNIIENIEIDHICGRTAAEAKSLIKAEPAYTQAVNDADSKALATFRAIPDPNAQTDASEHAVVDPIIQDIQNKATTNNWPPCGP